MGTANLGFSLTVAGVSSAFGAAGVGETETNITATLEKGWAGPISTDTDRVITTTEIDPEIEAADKVAIFWAGGMARDVVQSVTGGDGQVIKLSSGGASAEGDALPSDAVACIIAVELDIDAAWTGDDTQAIATNASARTSISFRKAADALCSTQEYLTTLPYYYIVGLGLTNPVDSDSVLVISAATADITSDQTLEIGILVDSA